MRKTFKMEDLDCANCAAKMQSAIQKIPGVQYAAVNFMTQKLVLDVEEDQLETVLEQVQRVCASIEPDCTIIC